ncbi:hypothetical protein [Sphingomonas sp. PAMC 26621]|uniref:hypothetical protein n=1 Tax=Sphingomonas sp. PAMC 26621 TaxID=1112213 RepID=UPI00028941B1|nr:hypothetical protein [Sphingomonas sp. PAMC 26621]
MDFEQGNEPEAYRAFGLADQSQPEYRVNHTIAVADPQALWAAAAARLLSAPGMTLNDALDVIGSREDPSITECIATMTAPIALPGCIMDDFWIDSLRSPPPKIEVATAVLGYRLAQTGKGQRRTALTSGKPPHLSLCIMPPGYDSDKAP